MNITRENIEPFLDAPIPAPQQEKVDAWLTAISAILTKRYGQILPPAVAPAVYDIVAQAITRRLGAAGRADQGGLVKRQSTGPSSVEYNTALSSLSGWFYPDESAQLDSLFGTGGTLSSVRTPAPDGVRYGNLFRAPIESQLGGFGLLVEDSEGDEYWEGDNS